MYILPISNVPRLLEPVPVDAPEAGCRTFESPVVEGVVVVVVTNTPPLPDCEYVVVGTALVGDVGVATALVGDVGVAIALVGDAVLALDVTVAFSTVSVAVALTVETPTENGKEMLYTKGIY